MIESLYVIDSAGPCLFSSPLVGVKHFEPDLVCGFIIAQFHYFRDTYGEDTKKFSLEKKEMLIQTFDLRDKTIILAIAYALGNEKEEKFSSFILDNLAKGLRSKEDTFGNIGIGVPKGLEAGIGEIVEDVLRRLPCLYLVRGFMGLADHCDKIDAPTGGRPCNFSYAVKQCEYYSPKSLDTL